ncbi:MAG: tetratricopeptide repeat protein [Bacteroidota bacterium]
MKKILFPLLAVAAMACNTSGDNSGDSGNTKDSTVVSAIPKEQLIVKINENNATLTNVENPDSLRFICSAQAELCQQFVKAYPTDPEAPAVLSYQAKALFVLGRPKEAADTYRRIIQAYQDYNNMPEVMFLYGLTLDQEVGDKAAAEKAYLKLIQTYPNHNLSQQARALITQLHMTDEELIKSFEEKNKK